MHHSSGLIVLITANFALAGIAGAAVENFDSLSQGAVPVAWKAELAGGYNGGSRKPGAYERDLYGADAKKLEIKPSTEWRIVADPSGKGNALQGLTQGTEAWCVRAGTKIRDGYVEVRAKLAKEVPQHRFYMNADQTTVGVVWRYQDAKNFYYAFTEERALKMFRMVDGKSEQIDLSHRIDFPAGKWYTLRVEFTGTTIKAYLNGQELYSLIDRELREAGGVGVCLNGDSCTFFDDFKYGAFASSMTETFDNLASGSPPPAPWKFGDSPDLARHYPAGDPKWDIYRIRHPRPGTNVLRVYSYGVQPYCVKSDVRIRDGYVEVEGKPVMGENERNMGIIWRWQDEKNYHVARVECMEARGYLSIFKMVDGRRTSIGRSRFIDTQDNIWHTLRIEFVGNKIVAFWDGKEAASATDDSLTQPGAVGVWTKLDALTLFDNLSFGERERPGDLHAANE